MAKMTKAQAGSKVSQKQTYSDYRADYKNRKMPKPSTDTTTRPSIGPYEDRKKGGKVSKMMGRMKTTIGNKSFAKSKKK